MALVFKKEKKKIPIFKLLALAVIGLILLLGSNAFANAIKDTIGYRGLLSPQVGRYQIQAVPHFDLGGDALVAWVIDTVTGQVRTCWYSTNPRTVSNKNPTPMYSCMPWTEDDRDEFGK